MLGTCIYRDELDIVGQCHGTAMSISPPVLGGQYGGFASAFSNEFSIWPLTWAFLNKRQRAPSSKTATKYLLVKVSNVPESKAVLSPVWTPTGEGEPELIFRFDGHEFYNDYYRQGKRATASLL